MSKTINPHFAKIAISLKSVANAVILSEAGVYPEAHRAAIGAWEMADKALETGTGDALEMVDCRTDLITNYLIRCRTDVITDVLKNCHA